MPVKTFQAQTDSPSTDKVLNTFNHPHQLLVELHLFLNGCVICCYFMLVNKRTVLNQNRVPVHVQLTWSWNQIYSIG